MRKKHVALIFLVFFFTSVAMVYIFANFMYPAQPLVAAREPLGDVTATGTIGDGGAPWRLYSCGTLIIDSGYVGHDVDNYDRSIRPRQWTLYSEHINKIIITGPITAGPSLRALFFSLPFVTAIEGLYHFDTSNVTNMVSVFAYSSGIRTLDLSSWDTHNVTNMGNMLGETNLNQLILGPNFTFVSTESAWNRNAGMPRAAMNDEYTGRWQNVGRGTPNNPRGRFVFTCTELMDNFDGRTHADTWVWQRTNSRQRPTLPGIRPEFAQFVDSETQPPPEGRICLWQYVGDITTGPPHGNSPPEDVPTLVLITSPEELAAFIEYNTRRRNWGSSYYQVYITNEAMYDEAFFATQFWLLYHHGKVAGQTSKK